LKVGILGNVTRNIFPTEANDIAFAAFAPGFSLHTSNRQAFFSGRLWVWLMLNNFSPKILGCGSSNGVCEITMTCGFTLI
jgi:hypothetical protein